MKERLTGAIILVALIVLLVPELLSGPKGPAASAPAGAASASSEEPPLRSYTINLGDDSHSQTESAGSPGSAAAGNGPGMPQPSGPEQPTAQLSAPQSNTAETAGSSPTTGGSSQSTGASPTASSQQSASQQAPTASQAPSSQPNSGQAPSARAAKSPAPSPKPPVAQKPSAPMSSATARAVTPKPTRTAAAEKTAKGRTAAANTAGNSEPSPGAWGVQLGVFASRENAERLALEVRVKGFKVSVSPVSSGSRKLYRVRVGPAPDRSGAQELQGRLKAAGRPGGTIVPYS